MIPSRPLTASTAGGRHIMVSSEKSPLILPIRRLAVREKPANPIAVALRHETIDVRRKCSIPVDFGRQRGVVCGDRSAHSHRDDLFVRTYHQVLAEPSFGGEAVQRACRELTVVRKMIAARQPLAKGRI